MLFVEVMIGVAAGKFLYDVLKAIDDALERRAAARRHVKLLRP